jgi:hypothetical protein
MSNVIPSAIPMPRPLWVAYSIRLPLAAADKVRANAFASKVREGRYVADLILAAIGMGPPPSKQLSIDDAMATNSRVAPTPGAGARKKARTANNPRKAKKVAKKKGGR